MLYYKTRITNLVSLSITTVVNSLLTGYYTFMALCHTKLSKYQYVFIISVEQSSNILLLFVAKSHHWFSIFHICGSAGSVVDKKLVNLLHSLMSKYSWERYESMSSSFNYGLNSSTDWATTALSNYYYYYIISCF